MIRFSALPFFTILFVLGWLSPSSLQGEITVDALRVKQIAALLAARPKPIGEATTNRAAWDKLAGEPTFQRWLESARQLASQPFPETSDELYLDFSKTGNRTRFQNVAFARRDRVSTYALAECLENKGAFVPALEASIKEVCTEPTWVLPAHDRSLANFEGKVVEIDLASSRLGWELATIERALQDKLSPDVRALIRQNVSRRLLTPYRDMFEGRAKQIQWLRATHNWNPVCHAGVVGAALAQAESRDERAWFIAAAEACNPYFLKGFGEDGYCSEGLAYWNYGFGHFVMLSEMVRQATAGKVDFLADPKALAPALFARQAEILSGIYPSIADCPPGARPDMQVSGYICRRFNLQPCNEGADNAIHPGRSFATTTLFAFLPLELPPISTSAKPASPLRTWYPDGGVLICRTASGASPPFAVSLKGGHNAEHHNHNDLGSFIVVSDKSALVVDPGSEVYTARTFSNRRYESDVLNSFGHSVPVIGGNLQKSGGTARAVVLQTNFTESADGLILDLTSAYDVPTLAKLHRSFVFQRGKMPSLRVRDEVEFKTADTFETALVTWANWEKVSESEFILRDGKGAVRVKIDTAGKPFVISSKTLDADVGSSPKATRIGLALKQPVEKATITLHIAPEKVSPN